MSLHWWLLTDRGKDNRIVENVNIMVAIEALRKIEDENIVVDIDGLFIIVDSGSWVIYVREDMLR